MLKFVIICSTNVVYITVPMDLGMCEYGTKVQCHSMCVISCNSSSVVREKNQNCLFRKKCNRPGLNSKLHGKDIHSRPQHWHLDITTSSLRLLTQRNISEIGSRMTKNGTKCLHKSPSCFVKFEKCLIWVPVSKGIIRGPRVLVRL